MAKEFSRLAILSCLALLGGCAGGLRSVPAPDYLEIRKDTGGATTPLSVTDLVNHIECEIAKDANLPTLAADKYIAQVTLTLKVDDNIGLSPALSFITPYKAIGTSITQLADANLNVDRQRTYTTTFALDMARLGADVPDRNAVATEAKCKDHGFFSLSGDLGIKKIIAAGIAPHDFPDALVASPKPPSTDKAMMLDYQGIRVPSVTQMHLLSDLAHSALQSARGGAGNAPVRPTFGSTVQFAITATGDAGPAWALKYFKGPSTSSKGVLNGGQIDTDTLIIAFSPATKTTLSDAIEAVIENAEKNIPHPSPDQAAAIADLKAAKLLLENSDVYQATVATQTLTNNMILQNLGTLP